MTEHLKCYALATCSLLAWAAACSDDVATGRRCGTGRTQPCAATDDGAGGQAGDSSAGRDSAAGSGAAAGHAGDEPIGTGSGALSVRIEDIADMTIEVVTLSCAGDCAEVEAVARGGHPPYVFAWEDGSSDPRRRVCPTQTAVFTVEASDTAIRDGEFPYAARSVRAKVTAEVLDCSDAGAPDARVYWADWTRVTVGTPGAADGVIALPAGDVAVSFAGEVHSASQDSLGASAYYVPAETFQSATVANAPDNNGILAISGEGQSAGLTHTIAFATPVRDPVIAIYSLGFGSLGLSSAWRFDAPCSLLSSGSNGYMLPPSLALAGNELTGTEGNGVIQLTGTFSAISFTVPLPEPFPGWGGLTVGARAQR